MNFLWTTILLSSLTVILWLLTKLYTARTFFTKLSAQGLPMPPHHLLAGHLIELSKAMKGFPTDALKVYFFAALARRYSRNGAFYLDLYPFAAPFLVITSPFLANQAVRTSPIACRKPDALRTWFWSITGGISMFDAEYHEWKELRDLFARGFSYKYLMKLVPGIVDEVEIYASGLREKARNGDIVQLDGINLRFMMDLIENTALNAKLNAQKGYNPLADAMLNQIKSKLANQEVNIGQWFNFVRPIKEWHNGRKMDAYINEELDKRFEIYKLSKHSGSKADGHSDEKSETFQSIIDLVIEDYMGDSSRRNATSLDQKFRTIATRNIRLLLFAGHDSTGSAISWCYYLLSKNPSALDKLIQEHDSVFGTDIKAISELIKTDSTLLKQLPYTTAVIKETLRLFPPASSIRQGMKDVDLVDEEGNRYPTENCMVYMLHLAIQHDPKYWPRPKEFLPERWLAQPGDELYCDVPVNGAWRPFEQGPRSCIGHTLVMLELKIILAIVVRELDVQDAYVEWDEKLGDKKGVKEVDGERAYQVDGGAAHPADGFPCRVTFREENVPA
ncbi:hypothetical protein SBOR_8049 [Sclerotinia borealis F-4128]|uniref:Cytochrome P450 n=1 Tax=Sclerotinia borealis (strain F-4128) TaxID=1432307 RepID=W9C9N7_SCLBF|nr:hypothetical protein SBOR_8049 [Sclerotinia borealis F-4128]